MAKFEFVNVDRPGDEKKHSTKIRRHVMKDIGKSRRKPKRRGETTIARGVLLDGESSSRDAGPHQQALVPSPLIDGRINGIVFPTEMDEERLNLARFLFVEARNSYHPFRFPWLSIGLSDSAAWYITLANAVLFKTMKPDETVKPEFSTNTEAMKWYTLSLESISKRLSDPKERSKEGLIIAISGFICHDSSTGNFTRQDIHLRGLKQLVDDRGGIDEITNPLLRLMISWHDLSGASYRNSAPYFDVPKGAITEIDTRNDTEYFQRLLNSWNEQCPYLGDILGALRATAAVASYINRHCHAPKFWTDDVLAARLLAPALHEILSLEGRALPSDPSVPNYSGIAAREAFRRSSLIFLVSVKVKFGAVSFELARHLNDFRQISQIPHVKWALVPELNLWAHTIAALQDKSSLRVGHVSAISSIMKTMGLTSGHQALEIVRSIIWVEALFADQVESLCQDIDSFMASDTAYQLSKSSVDLPLAEIIEGLDDVSLAQPSFEAF
ncbi:hypothetical protein F5Y19DRAFT_492294 [Xylariaceae sp. FL1651]|nr:hypothetical protein F5Y19DRAFT_492294 [Xylariaceae sp. FL1651]